ncbi:MAG: hypothetical protein RI991_1203, partial [Bacteroidota bacterium]
ASLDACAKTVVVPVKRNKTENRKEVVLEEIIDGIVRCLEF